MNDAAKIDHVRESHRLERRQRAEPSGSGKSALSDRRITKLRHDAIGFIFQSFNLMPVLNVFENIEFPLLLAGKVPPRKERREYANYLMEAVGLADWKKHKPIQDR